MQNNDITKLLGLKGLTVIKYDKKDEGHFFYVKSSKTSFTCPCCNLKTKSIHDTRIQKVRDSLIHGQPCFLMVHKRRINCKCGCRFQENIPFLPKHYHMTSRLYSMIISDLKDKISLTDLAKRYYVSVNTVQRLQKMLSYSDKPKLPKVLSIDEFKGNSDNIKYHCIILDPESGKLLDIIKDRKEEYLLSYFKRYSLSERKFVKFLVCDMWKPYVALAKKLFPCATIIIDKYHYVRQVVWAIDAVRKRIQKAASDKVKKIFFNCRKLLLKRRESLDKESLDKLELIFWHSLELANAYELKEMFFRAMDEDNPDLKAQMLSKWISFSKNSNIKEFVYHSSTFERWKDEITNSFYSTYTNGCIEGTNNLIKVIKRIAFGYRSFDNFRCRIMHIKT